MHAVDHVDQVDEINVILMHTGFITVLYGIYPQSIILYS